MNRNAPDLDKSFSQEKLIYLVLEDYNEPSASFVAAFYVRDDIQLHEEPLRNAVREFVKSGSEESEKALKESRGRFDWGDAMRFVPDSLFEKHGLRRVGNISESCFVDYYETLYDCNADDL